VSLSERGCFIASGVNRFGVAFGRGSVTDNLSATAPVSSVVPAAVMAVWVARATRSRQCPTSRLDSTKDAPCPHVYSSPEARACRGH
jgi:hypothetical protein